MSTTDGSLFSLDNLSQQDRQNFANLDAKFRFEFGAGNFGSFNINAFRNDPVYRDNIIRTSASSPGKALALKSIMEFFNLRVPADAGLLNEQPDFGKVSPKPFFDPIRGRVDLLAEQQRRQVTGDVNRTFDKATDRTSEAIAGTGLGRSGAAINEFQGIESQRASAEAGALERVETARLATQQQLDFNELQFSLNQELAEQGFDERMLRDALNFQRQMQLLNFEAALEYEPSSWLDTFGDVVSIGVGIASIYTGFGGGKQAA